MLHAQWKSKDDQTSKKPLIVLLHGYGADERDLLPLAESFSEDFAVASVRAPLRLGSGFAWFPLDSKLSPKTEEIAEGLDALSEWISGNVAAERQLIVLGFSQGMAMATSLARRAPERLAAVVGLSGFVIEADDELCKQLQFNDRAFADRKLPMFWGRDPQDPVIPSHFVNATAEWLAGHTALTKVQYAGIGHGIGPAEVKHIQQFVQMLIQN